MEPATAKNKQFYLFATNEINCIKYQLAGTDWKSVVRRQSSYIEVQKEKVMFSHPKKYKTKRFLAIWSVVFLFLS